MRRGSSRGAEQHVADIATEFRFRVAGPRTGRELEIRCGRAVLFHQCTYLSVYVALTNIPEGRLLTGFAMRSDSEGFLGVSAPLTKVVTAEHLSGGSYLRTLP